MEKKYPIADAEDIKLLKNLSSKKDIPHIIFYGPPGSGRMTRIKCVLNEIYGPSSLKTQKDIYTVKNKSKLLELNILYSRHHIEISPSDAYNQDTTVLTKFLSDTATNQNVLDLDKKN